MKISKKQLIEMDACSFGLERFIRQTNNTDEPVDVASLVGGENTYSDLLWLARKTLKREKVVRFACDCALINIEQIKPYTDQYGFIVDFLKNPNARAARAAADAVYAAVYAADAVYAAAARAAYAAAVVVVVADAFADIDAVADIADAAGDNASLAVNNLLKKLFS